MLPDDGLLARARNLRWYGIDRDGGAARFKNDIPEYGFKFNMNDINAAIGLANLERVDGLVARHRENAAFYDAELAGVAGLELTERAADRNPSFWYYSLKVDDRDAFALRMKEAGIATSEVHERNDVYGATRGSKALLPGLDSVAGRQTALPVGWWVSDEDRAHVVRTVKAGW